ncbi:STAS domain-containing protein [Puniceicoccales bacterium CK1056]|uniref:STAS domain-containing protein n=1 Tax=Oceanipulchritudo coccoides TaxID=2706888 RepID=A0A6B2M7A8_9BACT|nr:STAS domain-containing protein [Oceanipulchritudo coccoides]NDV63510.1 STAS domain-containing protein [Oceanipulchritudo coccoides]
MSQDEPHFLVNPYDDPVIVKINGKASFINSGPVKNLFDRLVEQGKTRFVIDFQQCSGMDSTFLGILAGLGIKLMKMKPKGTVVLTRLGARNSELVRNLGLHRLLILDDGAATAADNAQLEAVGDQSDKSHLSEVENARLVLQAHENLVEIDDSNKTKFQDVISFLKNQMEEQ